MFTMTVSETCFFFGCFSTFLLPFYDYLYSFMAGTRESWLSWLPLSWYFFFFPSLFFLRLDLKYFVLFFLFMSVLTQRMRGKIMSDAMTSLFLFPSYPVLHFIHSDLFSYIFSFFASDPVFYSFLSSRFSFSWFFVRLEWHWVGNANDSWSYSKDQWRIPWNHPVFNLVSHPWLQALPLDSSSSGCQWESKSGWQLLQRRRTDVFGRVAFKPQGHEDNECLGIFGRSREIQFLDSWPGTFKETEGADDEEVCSLLVPRKGRKGLCSQSCRWVSSFSVFLVVPSSSPAPVSLIERVLRNEEKHLLKHRSMQSNLLFPCFINWLEYEDGIN